MGQRVDRFGLRAVAILLVGWLVWVPAACVTVETPPPTVTASAPENLPHKVAILPFVNRTSDPQATEVVRRMFYNFFSSKNYLDLELSPTDDTLKNRGLYRAVASGQSVPASKLGSLLGVDGIIEGEVLTYGRTFALVYAEAQAGLKARMVSTADGTVIWEYEHTAHLREGDVPLSLAGLAGTLVKTYLRYQKNSAVKAATDLCLHMVETIPDPPALQENGPTIKTMVHNGAGSLLRPGTQLKVVLIGEPGQTASWAVTPLTDPLPMTEREPGVYIGAYRVKIGDRTNFGRVVGYLKSDQGAESRWLDVLGPVAIGQPTPLPQDISKDTVLTAARGPYLAIKAVIVRPGATLTIEPGTVIWFNRSGMAIRGAVSAIGTSEHPIRFLPLGSNRWKGIFLDRADQKSRFHFCLLRGAEFGLKVRNSTLELERCVFEENGWGLVVEDTKVDIQQTLFRASEQVGVSARNSVLVMGQSTIGENGAGGLLLDATQATMRRSNLFNNGKWELKVLSGPQRIEASDNWWGTRDPESVRIDGMATPKPLLPAPANAVAIGL